MRCCLASALISARLRSASNGTSVSINFRSYKSLSGYDVSSSDFSTTFNSPTFSVYTQGSYVWDFGNDSSHAWKNPANSYPLLW